MFNNQKFLTRGVMAEIPSWLTNLMWHMVLTMEIEKKDYLQVFNLVANGTNQQVTHSQEEHTYERTFTFPTDEPITTKIFVIDDETHTTMLLAEEY